MRWPQKGFGLGQVYHEPPLLLYSEGEYDTVTKGLKRLELKIWS